MPKILIIDDEADIRELLADILVDEGYQVCCSKNASQGLNHFENEKPDLVILDIWLEGSDSDGIGVLKRIKANNSDVPVLMISGHGNIETAVQTIKLGAYDFIEKPFKSEKLIILVKRALETYSLKQELNSLVSNKAVADKLDGQAKITINLSESAKLAATSNSRIIIYGEPGTGKEVLARFIHGNSTRAHSPFIPFYPFGLSNDTAQEELLGIDDGKRYKIGLVEKANGGTLYIDEVSALSEEIQNLLLKILQENAFQKLGTANKLKTDLRIIVSSTKDLSVCMEEGTFNKSLFYRLNVVPLHMPALRDRKEDLPELVLAFSILLSQSLNLPELKLSHEAIAFLQQYNWPGNIRQLKNTVEWLMIMHGRSEKTVQIVDLPQEITNNPETSLNNNIDEDIILKPLKTAREAFEKKYLNVQLARFSGNISKTAEFVGMHRAALHRKLRGLKIANE